MSEPHRIRLIQHTIGIKLRNQRLLIKSYAKNHHDLELAHMADELKRYEKRIKQETNHEMLRGLEGLAAKKYFSAFPLILDDAIWHWNGRTRRPPKDPVNALLSYGYAFLEREIRIAALGAGLDVRFGFFHSNNGRKDILVFDLIEK